MPKFCFVLIIASFSLSMSFAQKLKRIDGSKISVDSLNAKIEYLMKAAQVSGVAVSVFNDNKPVFSKTYGLADVQKNIPFQQSSVMYACSFAKMVFAYIAMQFVEEKVIDLDKPLVEYLNKPLPDYKINGKRRGYHDLKDDDRYKKNHGSHVPNAHDRFSELALV